MASIKKYESVIVIAALFVDMFVAVWFWRGHFFFTGKLFFWTETREKETTENPLPIKASKKSTTCQQLTTDKWATKRNEKKKKARKLQRAKIRVTPIRNGEKSQLYTTRKNFQVKKESTRTFNSSSFFSFFL